MKKKLRKKILFFPLILLSAGAILVPSTLGFNGQNAKTAETNSSTVDPNATTVINPNLQLTNGFTGFYISSALLTVQTKTTSNLQFTILVDTATYFANNINMNQSEDMIYLRDFNNLTSTAFETTTGLGGTTISTFLTSPGVTYIKNGSSSSIIVDKTINGDLTFLTDENVINGYITYSTIIGGQLVQQIDYIGAIPINNIAPKPITPPTITSSDINVITTNVSATVNFTFNDPDKSIIDVWIDNPQGQHILQLDWTSSFMQNLNGKTSGTFFINGLAASTTYSGYSIEYAYADEYLTIYNGFIGIGDITTTEAPPLQPDLSLSSATVTNVTDTTATINYSIYDPDYLVSDTLLYASPPIIGGLLLESQNSNFVRADGFTKGSFTIGGLTPSTNYTTMVISVYYLGQNNILTAVGSTLQVPNFRTNPTPVVLPTFDGTTVNVVTTNDSASVNFVINDPSFAINSVTVYDNNGQAVSSVASTTLFNDGSTTKGHVFIDGLTSGTTYRNYTLGALYTDEFGLTHQLSRVPLLDFTTDLEPTVTPTLNPTDITVTDLTSTSVSIDYVISDIDHSLVNVQLFESGNQVQINNLPFIYAPNDDVNGSFIVSDLAPNTVYDTYSMALTFNQVGTDGITTQLTTAEVAVPSFRTSLPRAIGIDDITLSFVYANESFFLNYSIYDPSQLVQKVEIFNAAGLQIDFQNSASFSNNGLFTQGSFNVSSLPTGIHTGTMAVEYNYVAVPGGSISTRVTTVGYSFTIPPIITSNRLYMILTIIIVIVAALLLLILVAVLIF